MSAAAPPPKLSLDNTYGVFLVAVIVAAFLHGVTCVQGWCYFLQQRDAWPLKVAVAGVLTFDTIHQGLITHAAYEYFIVKWGNIAALPVLTRTVLIEILFNAFTGLIVQSFLTRRVYVLSNRNILLTSFAASLVLAEFVAITTYYGLVRNYATYYDLNRVRHLSIAVNVLAAVGDVVITITLCFLLHMSRTGVRRSDTMINKLIIFTVNTGALTSLCALGAAISVIASPNTFVYVAFFLCIGRLYANSFLATLNARSMIRSGFDQVANASRVRKDKSGVISSIRFRFASILRDGSQDPHDISTKIDKSKGLVYDTSVDSKSDPLELQSVSV